MLSGFPHLEFSASRSFLLALPLSPIWSIHYFKSSYGEISSYALSHFCLSISFYVKRECPQTFLHNAHSFQGCSSNLFSPKAICWFA